MAVRRKEVTNKITQILKGTSYVCTSSDGNSTLTFYTIELAVLSLRASCRSLRKLLFFGALVILYFLSQKQTTNSTEHDLCVYGFHLLILAGRMEENNRAVRNMIFPSPFISELSSIR